MNSYIVTGASGLPSVSPFCGMPANSFFVSLTALSCAAEELLDEDELSSPPPEAAITATAATATITATITATTMLRRELSGVGTAAPFGVLLADFELIARH